MKLILISEGGGVDEKTEIKYVGWCHECKCLGSFICGNCNPNEKYSFGRPSEFMPKDKNRWVRM